MPKFRMTNTEQKLKRDRMQSCFRAGKEALEELKLPYFLSYGSALGALREGQFQPYEDDITVGIYSWDLAALQRDCPDKTTRMRDSRIINVFDRLNFDPVAEMMDNAPPGEQAPPSMSVCPRTFIAEGWKHDMAFPILYKFTHRETLVRFDIIVFTMQFGQLWDFADGGAETSSGWRYSLFSPQPVEFEKIMTFTMPPKALEEHYGSDWHVPRAFGYIENLSRCENRCQVLRVHPWDVNMAEVKCPKAIPWQDFKSDMRDYRIKYATAMTDAPHEYPEQKLDLHKIESKPMVLFQAAGIVKNEGNKRMREGNYQGALDKYEEGLYLMRKCLEVLTTWRLIFRQNHNDKAEADRNKRSLKYQDMDEGSMPEEFRGDQREERLFRLCFLLNAAQAAVQLKLWDVVEVKTGLALELDPKNVKALYRRGLGRVGSGDTSGAIADFWRLVKVSEFESKEALVQLTKLLPKDEVAAKLQQMKQAHQKDTKYGKCLMQLEEDERISEMDERRERYKSDCDQRKHDKQKELSFDDWVKQYEWRYDADERAKVRSLWPACFNHMGSAPLPVEDWEIDYLTHKEIDKIVYQRQTKLMGERRKQLEGKTKQPEALEEKEGFVCALEVDEEDQAALEETVVKKGYNYWW